MTELMVLSSDKKGIEKVFIEGQDIDRIAAEQAKAEEEKAAREADREHQGNVNRAAMEAIQQAGSLTDEQARAVIVAIIKGEVPSVTINY